MHSILRGLLVLAAMGSVSFPTNPPAHVSTNSSRAVSRRAVAPAAPGKLTFNSSQLEFYQSQDVINYIRPGLQVTVNSVTIGSDGRPVVDVSFTDALNQPLDRLGQTTPGPLSISFIGAVYSPNTRQYTAFTTRVATAAPPSPTPGVTAVQASTDSGGQWTDLGTGHATYKFKTPLPAGDDPTATHSIGIYASRVINDPINQINKTYYANTVFNFRPDGQAVTAVWDKMRTSSTCNQCHDPLMVHGGARQDVKLCALCHQPQTTDPDTGNTVDMKVMAHKIHMGSSLPSVKAGTPYQIIGFQQSIADFSDVVFPQDIRNCDTCHVGNDPKNVGAQSTAYLTNPSRAACGSCHDDINWETGANHPAGAMTDDKACAVCHVPDSGQEFDASIKGAHTVPYKSKQLAGLTATVASVKDLAPGKNPTVAFAVKNGDGSPVDATKLSTFSPMFAGPTASYSKYFRENALTNGKYDPTTGLTSYTFTAAVPADATGTWTVTTDIRRTVALKRADNGPDVSFREAPMNPIKYVAVTDATPQPRRKVVDINQCNVCHGQLAFHGGQRKTTDECVICHNPTNTAAANQPTGPQGGKTEGISFQRMIHRIHTGEELTNPFVIGNTNFQEIVFPGDRRDCAKCHVGTTYTLPVASTAAVVQTPSDYFSPQGPATASCLGCHDGSNPAAHAFLNTATFPGSNLPAEACATCHGTGADWAVEKVHAR